VPGVSDTDLKVASALQAERDKHKTVIKDLEAKASQAKVLDDYRALAAAGKWQEAAKLIGYDIEAGTADVIKNPPDPVRDKLSAVETDLAAIKATEKTRAEQAMIAVRDANAAQVIEQLKKDPGPYKYLSRNPNWVKAAYGKAWDAFNALDGNPDQPGDDQSRAAFLSKHLDEAEKYHTDLAQYYSTDPAYLHNQSSTDPALGTRTKPNSIDTSMRGGTGTPQRRPQQTFEDVKRARRAQS